MAVNRGWDKRSHNTSSAPLLHLTRSEIDPLTYDLFHILEVITNCFLINSLGTFGIVGNTINIVVLTKHGFRETTNIILFALSISDLLFSFILPVTRLHCIVKYLNPGLAETINTFTKVFLFMPKYVFLSSSFTYVTIIALERFVAVLFPFKVAIVFQTKTTKAFVVGVPILVFVLLIPTFRALTYEWRFLSHFNQTIAIVKYTQFYLDNQVFLNFYAWVGLNYTFSIFSTIIVTFCCVAIGFRLVQASIKRELMTSRSAGYDIKVVKMLITVCVIFLAVSIPNIVLYTYFVPNFIFLSHVDELVDNVCAVLYAMNSSANFLVYVSMSSKFAKTYKSLLPCQRSANK